MNGGLLQNLQNLLPVIVTHHYFLYFYSAIILQHKTGCIEFSQDCKEKEMNYAESLEPPSMQV